MRDVVAQAWALQVRAAAAFAEVVRVGERVGVSVLPVKGVLTARLLYADPAQRTMVDVDLRVRPRDLAVLAREGQKAGWCLLERSRAYGTATFEVVGQRVELETTVGPPGLCALSVDVMLARASRRTAPFDFSHLEPDLHDHAVLLLVNVFKDNLTDASENAWNDLARLPRLAGFSFEALADRARGAKVATAAWIVSRWLVERRAAPQWNALSRALGDEPPRRLYTAIAGAMHRPGRPPSLSARAWTRLGPDTLGMRLQSAWSTVAWAADVWTGSDGVAGRARVLRGSRHGRTDASRD